MSINNQFDLDAELKKCKTAEDLLGKDGLIKRLTKTLIEKMLDEEMSHQLGYEKYARPLLLALEAAIENCPDRLADIEPEIRRATQHMFERLSVSQG